MSRGMRNQRFAYAKTKTQISCAVTAQLISAFVFAIWIVQYLFILNTKFQALAIFSGWTAWFVSDPVRIQIHAGAQMKIFSSTFFGFLAHLSRGLIGYPIVCPCSNVRPSSICPSNLLPNSWAIKAKICLEPSWLWETNVVSSIWVTWPMIGAMPIFGKSPSKIFSRSGGPISTQLGMKHLGL